MTESDKAKVGLSNREVVVLALFAKGGTTMRIHTEDISVECHRLAPSSFSWTKYPEFPDKDIVRVALTDARKEKYGALVSGRTGQNRGQFHRRERAPASDGWALTDAGIRWAQLNRHRLADFDSAAEKTHRQQSLKFLNRVRKHKVFGEYQGGSQEFQPAIGDLADLLRCRVDADLSVWEDRLDRIRKHAAVVEQPDFADFAARAAEVIRSERLG